jgi:chromosome segregation ATPase
MNRIIVCLACSMAAALGATVAQGQAARPGNDSTRQMQQMQQLASERTRLEAENARLKADLEKTKAEAAALQKEQAALAGRARQAEASSGELTRRTVAAAESLEKQREQMNELVTRFRETASTLRTVEQEKSELAAALETQQRGYTECAQHNVELARIAIEALDRYEGKGFWQSVGEVEPFTQLSRTRVENLIGEYRERIEESRVEPTVPMTGPGPN